MRAPRHVTSLKETIVKKMNSILSLYNLVLPGFSCVNGYYWVYSGAIGIFFSFIGFYWVFNEFTEFYRVFNDFYLVSIGSKYFFGF